MSPEPEDKTVVATTNAPMERFNDQSAWENVEGASSSIVLPQSNVLTESPEVIIVGQGVAGAALAAVLGKQGRRVLAIERSLAEPIRIVGELLQPGGVEKLVELGLEECLEGFDAQKVDGYAVWFNNDTLHIPYPEVRGCKPTGRSFHHGRFIQKLRVAALNQKTVEVREGTVVSLIEEDDQIRGVVYRKKGGESTEVRAPLTIVCDGCFSALRKGLTNANYALKSYFVGLILDDCESPVANHGNVVLANPTPVLLYPISSTQVRALVDVPELPKGEGGLAGYLSNVVAPQLPAGVRSRFLQAVSEGKAKTMPNRVLAADPINKQGVILLGDALNMRHPFTGGGMTVALTDVAKLNDLLKGLAFNDEKAVSTRAGQFYSTRKGPASPINILSVALYDVFSEQYADLREACYSYLSQGPLFYRGPISLLAGISRNDYLLLYHFFMVALYGVGRALLPFPTPRAIYRGYSMLRDAVQIIKPLAEKESPNPFLVYGCKLLSFFFPSRNK